MEKKEGDNRLKSQANESEKADNTNERCRIYDIEQKQ